MFGPTSIIPFLSNTLLLQAFSLYYLYFTPGLLGCCTGTSQFVSFLLGKHKFSSTNLNLLHAQWQLAWEFLRSVRSINECCG